MSTKEKVLKALEEDKGSYVSGEVLAQSCGVSRNAIWKSITELRKKGYPIKSVNNRGYMLEENSDIISVTGICMYLESEILENPDGNIHPEKIHVYEELDSTNNEAKRNLLFRYDRMMHGTIFIARQQTAGKGHGGRSFSSPEGGIYLSMILEPEKIRDKTVPVTEFISASVRTVIERLYKVRTEKKKDSSLYVGEEKVCGILTEGISDLETGIYSNFITGIGIRAEKLQSFRGVSPQKNELIANLIKELLVAGN